MAIKILILTSSTPANVYLVNQLLLKHDPVGMVIEAPPPALTMEEKKARRRNMLRRYGALRTLNKLLLNAYRSRYTAPAHARTIENRLFANQPVRYLKEVPTIVVPSINDPACANFIDRLNPDLLAVCGTGVIKPEIFGRAPLGAVNIHTGITPDYRSADPILWALHNNEPDKVGVTIHFVDQGIDTGAIIHQQRVPVYANDSLADIYARCVEQGSHLYLQALAEIAAGSVRTKTHAGSAGRSYYSIDFGILQYLTLQWRLHKLQRRLPLRPPAHSTTARTGR